MNLSLYQEIKGWKVPFHKSRATIAKNYLKLLKNVEIIGIAGSVGKTLTQNTLYSVLSQKYPTIAGEENLDPTFRIPQTILKAKPWHKYLILEYGVEHPGEMDYYTQLAAPKYVILTTIAEEHLKFFKSMEGVIEEESKILKKLSKNGYALLNSEDPYSKELSKQTKATVVWYGQHAKKGVKISHYRESLNGVIYRIHYGGDVAVVRSKVVGKHQLTSAYAAATIGILKGLTIKQIAKGLSQVEPPKHRLTLKITDHVNIIDDSYNSSPKAAKESLKTLISLGKGKKKIAVLGEMRDLGTSSQQAHKDLGAYIANTKINYLITVGKASNIISMEAKRRGFKGALTNVKNTKEATVMLKTLAVKKALVLVKGSRHEHLERVVSGLLHKSTHINCYHCGKIK